MGLRSSIAAANGRPHVIQCGWSHFSRCCRRLVAASRHFLSLCSRSALCPDVPHKLNTACKSACGCCSWLVVFSSLSLLLSSCSNAQHLPILWFSRALKTTVFTSTLFAKCMKKKCSSRISLEDFCKASENVKKKKKHEHIFIFVHFAKVLHVTREQPLHLLLISAASWRLSPSPPPLPSSGLLPSSSSSSSCPTLAAFSTTLFSAHGKPFANVHCIGFSFGCEVFGPLDFPSRWSTSCGVSAGSRKWIIWMLLDSTSLEKRGVLILARTQPHPVSNCSSVTVQDVWWW